MERTRRGLRGALPAPVVRCNRESEADGLCIIDWHTKHLCTLVLLPRGTIYPGTQRNTIELSVCGGCLPWGESPYGLTAPLRTLVVYHLALRLASQYTASMNKPTTVRLTPQDKQLIERIKEIYGCPSDIAAIRLALKMVAWQEVIPTRTSPNKDSLISPKL